MRHGASLLSFIIQQNVGIPKSFSSNLYLIPKFSENELFSVFLYTKNPQSFGIFIILLYAQSNLCHLSPQKRARTLYLPATVRNWF